jgi:DNA-binding NarL/FixJ family response regulator
MPADYTTGVVVAPFIRSRDRDYARGAMRVRVLIVDDLEPFRSAARAVVQATAGFEVAGEVASGEESLDKVKDLRPDLVLMDVNLPGMGGAEATRRILADMPGAVVVLLSTRDADEVGSLAADCGAAAYIAKSIFSSRTLTDAWAAATNGAR